ncbi:hypothetical protein NEHOM01_0901 [Nematocida homosporus]|uniref:uncharacterized protein n=1 Tax=Nematocida homosporus TaxID=1912981 RepID=UPI00221F6FFD|nr:uncharacterized protein NEHOM01_0901 [Nematocida homosporus]KAI5185542.1 hypothetical protein NEHOM01_0901 [Nematocida homosporus]
MSVRGYCSLPEEDLPIVNDCPLEYVLSPQQTAKVSEEPIASETLFLPNSLIESLTAGIAVDECFSRTTNPLPPSHRQHEQEEVEYEIPIDLSTSAEYEMVAIEGVNEREEIQSIKPISATQYTMTLTNRTVTLACSSLDNSTYVVVDLSGQLIPIQKVATTRVTK